MHLLRQYMKISLLFNILVIPHATNSQTERELSSIALEEKKDSTALNDQSKACFPPCREGYMCSNGECISKCNPPCPANMKCGNDGECHEILDRRSLDIKKQANLISNIKRVSSADEVIQGFVIRTNRLNSEVQIGNTKFPFDNELYLLAPARDYSMILNAKGQNIKSISVELEPGHFEDLTINLRPIRLNLGVSCGLGFLKESVGPLGIFDVGMTIASKHFFGMTSSFFMEDDTTIIDNTTDTLFQRHQTIDFQGFGATYGYTGFYIKKVCVVPKVSIGFWETEDITERLIHYRGSDSSSNLNLKTTERKNIEHYFFKPGLEIQFGYKLIGFRINTETYLGEGIGPSGISLGFLFRIL